MEPAKVVTITLNASETQAQLIERAAEILCKSREDFILDEAYQKACEVLLDRTQLKVSESEYLAFIKLLEGPVPANENLRRLLGKHND